MPKTWLLTLLMGLGPFSMQILIPSLPLLAGIFAVPYATAQMTLTVYLVGIALGQLIYGPLSDRYGRRPLLLAGLAIYLLGSLAALLAPTIGWVVVARAAQAAGGCAGMVLTRAIIRDVFPRDQAASKIGFVMMGMTVAPMLAPLLGAELTTAFGWRATMLACVGFGRRSACWRCACRRRWPRSSRCPASPACCAPTGSSRASAASAATPPSPPAPPACSSPSWPARRAC
ncbi:MFS transporter [Teichococcus aestuarii]|uniref:MFS transporter n=1 Tax=Teichococcus aestuarii TaxID=568898 RepID=UPI00360F4894